jgi:hypothetical protein
MPQQKKQADMPSALPNTFNDQSPASKVATSQAQTPVIDPITIASTNADNKQTGVNRKGGAKRISQNKKGKLSTTIWVASTADDAGMNDAAKENASTELTTIPSAEKEQTPKIKPPVADAVAVENNTDKKSDTAKKDLAEKVPSTNKLKVESNKKNGRFYLLASIGADAGSVHFLSLKDSKIVPKYGVGIGYQINKKLSVQTGFYASWKKYIAGPEDYNTKHGTYWDTVKILKVAASCLVYDIPIILRYNFIQRPTTTFYTTAGISSFIMKQEDYIYHYNDYSNYHVKSKTYTGNKNLFAVFDLSAGIEKKINSQFSILAEPSIGIPLGGVGEGSVKLYSTALQLGLKYNPLKKKK